MNAVHARNSVLDRAAGALDALGSLAFAAVLAFLLGGAPACSGAGGGSGSGPELPAGDAGPGDATPDIPEVGPPPPDLGADAGDAPEADAPKDPLVYPGSGAPRAFAAACESSADCDSALCVAYDDGRACSRPCVDECPPGWQCRALPEGWPDITFACFWQQSFLCQPCTSDLQCGPGQCLAYAGGPRCGRPCLTDGDCPAGFACEPRASVADPANTRAQCVPVAGLCDCTPANAGEERPCVVQNAFGACAGFETCDGVLGWSACSGGIPAAEACDGLDNDCDGVVDEEASAPIEACLVENPNGRCTGDWQCRGSAGWQCVVAQEPSVEVCDGLDNDCDGATDEDFRAAGVGAYVDLHHCGDCLTDCAGRFPHATAGCDASGDAPQCVVLSCEAGFYRANATTCLPVTSSLCLACADDANCAVPGDACLELAAGRFCGRDCGPESLHGADCPAGYTCTATAAGGQQCLPTSGACDCMPENDGLRRACVRRSEFGACFGEEVCDPAGGWSACSAPEPVVEQCDGADNDCDLAIDEDVVSPSEPCESTNEFGTCGGRWVCAGGAGFQCLADTPAADVCDGLDNDCDGGTDEDFRDPETGLYVHPDHCGLCGRSCAEAVLYASETACLADALGAFCAPLACEEGFVIPPSNPRVCISESAAVDCLPCTYDAQCAGLPGARCEALDRGSFCTRACAADSDCVADFACIGGRCLPPTRSCTCLPGQQGSLRTCTVTNEYGSCAGLQTCDPTATPGWSACDAGVPGPETCNGRDDDCNGFIDEAVHPDAASCAVENEFGACPGVWACAQQPGGGAAWTCLGPAAAPDLCDGRDNDCDGTTDGAYPELRVPCTAGVGACLRYGLHECTPDGLATVCNAVAAEPGSEDCNGVDDDCDGFTDEDLPAMPCDEQGGVCLAAEKVCGGPRGWLPCLPGDFGPDYEAPEASCDGRDNDCDGSTDEDLVPDPCAEQRGVCFGSRTTCGGAAGWLACTGVEQYGLGYEPNETRCDFLDNDCDGSTDEGYLVAGRYAHPDHCGTCGHSCAAALPHAESVCDAETEPPSCRITACEPGYVQLDMVQCAPLNLGLCDPCVTAETCLVPGAECAPLADGDFCVNPCVIAADCPDGYRCGELTGAGTFCLPETDACQCTAENLSIEKGCRVPYPDGDAPLYACIGVQLCTAAGWSDCVLPAESCNLTDDDCDGLTDEDFVAADGRFSTDTACGGCGNDCTGIAYPGGYGYCNAEVDPPACATTCSPTCFDVNGNPNDGCECCNPAPVDYPDLDGNDENCDGIDGEVENGVFVAKDGSDGNDGTFGFPKATIQAGIQAAQALSRRDVYVASGVYTEAVTLAPGIGVYGGYRADFAVRNPQLYEVAIFGPAPTSGRPGAVNALAIRGGAAGSTVLEAVSVFGFAQDQLGASSYAVYVRDCDQSLRLTSNRIVAGRGGPGGRGADGTNGTAGAAGAAGRAALDLGVAYGVVGHGCQPQHHSAGGLGGSRQCGSVDTSGGAGGNRICPAYVGGVTVAPVTSENGSAGRGPTSGGTGGAAGWDVYHQRFNCEGYDRYGDVEGLEGGEGPGGGHGTAGAGCSATLGSVVNALWVPATATSGGAGTPGSGGGGGGSGAGAYVHTSCNSHGFGTDNLGGTGGGGGAGGCGATGGTAGQGGGGAFGLFVVFDTLPTSLPDIRQNLIVGGQGGAGADGGAGGVGGVGGLGGQGGAGGGTGEEVPPDPTFPAFKGGRGGTGGAGGHGGGGGGGCGGPAVGFYAANTGTLDLGPWRSGNLWLSTGLGGAGGLGGFSLGAPGLAGAQGPAAAANF